MSRSANDLEIVKAMIETKAVDFQAIGNAFAKFAAASALNASADDDFVCGVGRRFILVYKHPIHDGGPSLEALAGLRALGVDVKG